MPTLEDTPTDVDQGVAPDPTAEAPATVAADQPGDVQPTPAVQEEQPPSGQDFIAPYLEGVDDAHRNVVAERLEAFRKDQDAQVTKRFERLKAYEEYAQDPSELDTPVAIYENLLQNPLDTLEWVVDQFKQNMNVDLRAQLLEKWGKASEQPAEPAVPDDPDQPLTRSQFEALQREQAEKAQQEQAQAQAREKANGWLEQAASKYKIELGEGDVVLREAILRQAAALMHQGQVKDGQKAIEMSVEAFSTRFAPKQQKTPTPALKVAEGGEPARPPQVDWTDKRQRQDAMLAMLKAQQQE